MAAATAGYEWNRSSPLRSSPDTTSPMYPDRPIRPLPKRRLRARLSPEQAEAIVYPPAPPSSGPLFSFPYSPAETRGNGRVGQRRGESDHHACHCGHNHSEVESEEDEDERGAPLPSSPSYHYARNVAGKSAGGATAIYPKPGSTSSSADGYESFENTNNKKKRKIPNMGTSIHHTNLSAEMASMGLSNPHELAAPDDGDGVGRYYTSAPSTPQHNTPGTGIAGAGRGRFGRSASGRSERRVLGTSTNLGNAKAATKRPPDQGGIISTAIANAQATPPPAGSENVSLLQQEASKSSTNKTQFTFTCGSDSANKMVWPGQQNGPYPQPPGSYPTGATGHPTQPTRARAPTRPDAPMVSTQGTQTSPNINGAQHPPSAKNAAPPKNGQPNQQVPAPRKPRRSASKLYAYAARKRRIQQEYANFHNPPNPAWICEFCEYEDIFGAPPEALIRQYEIKDRKERKRIAEKRRLLEKARMKGRKGKKASKKAQNNANNAQHSQNAPAGGYDRRMDEGPLDGQEEEYYDDEYDDIPPQASAPGKPCDHPGCHHSHHPKTQAQGLGDPSGGGKGVNGEPSSSDFEAEIDGVTFTNKDEFYAYVYGKVDKLHEHGSNLRFRVPSGHQVEMSRDKSGLDVFINRVG
ncbi:uncharacterized protein BDR25DRAFT_47711 [Lindgomyces ingoldianus]|uniref:Uncharacterized protein n=1 Tax=Lindgomyces ingoldianus TaxID=673940 RepID=A0ACB6QT69_9PLEO|nr:uncharacterized protein BDR25DRAFT_47711 [Lindgomyces ingoldianus]KAF2469282.1 hypothetical protein BDR25DRAFT_47711 [Lindgomyces ingoldianus]